MDSRHAFVAALTAIVLAGCAQPAPEEPAATDNATTEPAAAPVSTGTDVAATPAAGGSVATGGQCGTIAGLQCASGADFCKTPAGQCDVADAAGTCTTKPEVCTQEYDPVCGCDGKTYGNACTADAAGVNVASKGECTAG